WNEYTVLICTNKIPNFLFLGCVQSYIQYLVLMYQYSSSHQQDLAVVSTLVDGMKNIDTSTPDIEYNFGHNQETENWVFY
ncbi:hypothetical protein QJN73_25675, partial [Escherichia coli]